MRKGFTPIIIAGIILVEIVVVGIIYLKIPKNLQTTPVQLINKPTELITQTPNKTTISLPVAILKTNYGIEGMNPSYPKSISISVPQEFSDQVGAYGVSDLIIVGLKDWIGEGQVGADGGSYAYLYPIGGSSSKGTHISISLIPGCVGCAYDSAAHYFPKARQWVLQNENTDIPEKPGLVKNFVTPQLVKYNLPDTSDEMEVNGVAYFKDDGQPYFVGMEITMPPQQHNIVIAILDMFIEKQELLKQ